MTKIALTSLGCLLLLIGTWNTEAQDRQTHLNQSEATKLFPRTLGGYQLKDVKIKDKSSDWKEYSATFKPSKKGKELKVVINDVIPNGEKKWRDQFHTSKDSISQHPAKEVRDGDKYSVLVLVGERFRVDFKSREVSPEKIREMAEAFNFGPINKLAIK